MVVLTNEGLRPRQAKLVRQCTRCRKPRWFGQFENLYAGRCIACTNKLRRQAKCRNCGGPSGLYRNRVPRKYCRKPECQTARKLDGGAAAGQAHRARYAKAKTKICKPCGKRKPLTLEHFAAVRKDADGNVTLFHTYCRPCQRAETNAKYASDPDRKAKTKARVKAHKDRQRQRMLLDPAFAEQIRAHHRELTKKCRDRKKLRAQQEAKEKPILNRGPGLPAKPLMDAIEAWMVRDEIRDVDAATRLGVSERRFWDWRQPGAITRFGIVDLCLVAMDLLWFDVFDPVEYPEVAEIWEGSC